MKGDLLSICAAIRELEPGFACGAATVTAFNAVMKKHPEYAPRMVVNLHPLNGACAGPWAVFSGSNLTKSDELAVLDQAGLPCLAGSSCPQETKSTRETLDPTWW